jgi:hypothetical protein
LGYRPDSGDLGVVVDHDAAIAGGVDIQFHAIRIEHHGTPEGGSRIFVLVSGSAPVGDHNWPTHGLR